MAVKKIPSVYAVQEAILDAVKSAETYGDYLSHRELFKEYDQEKVQLL